LDETSAEIVFRNRLPDRIFGTRHLSGVVALGGSFQYVGIDPSVNVGNEVEISNRGHNNLGSCDDSIVLRAMTISAAEMMMLLLCNGGNGQKRNRLTDPDPADCANPLNIIFAILSYLYRFGAV
jgi:hypothetical protein